jgi:pimeloyl-ACP methyl ester carboxylesterase
MGIMSSEPGQGRLSFTVTGDGQQPLLLLHGLGADRRQPLALVDAAVRHQCQVLAPDLRAHGTTSLDERDGLLTFLQLASDVEDLVSDVALARPLIVIGISMGAGVAAQLLAKGNVPVRGLILIRPAWHWEPHPPNLSAFPRITELLRTHGPDRGTENFRHSEDYAKVAAVSTAAADALLGQFRAFRAVERAQRLTAIPASRPTRPAPSDAAKLVIGSTHDPVHPLPLAEQVAEDLGATLTIVSPRYDAPDQHHEQVARAIRNFIRDM